MAGAVVGAVKDGQILLAKGYGYADTTSKRRVLASETLFRPGSISKLFTAIAVMQLVEQGKLDLDHDVSSYIDFPLAKSFPEPVTLRRLLTHTAGFEETLRNLFIPAWQPIRPLHDYLVSAMPAQIFPPGKVPSYSNWGLTLAGYIVERTSGEPFDSYVANHILRPLKMDHSTFTQPLPEALAENMSKGYFFANAKVIPFEVVQASPAGALSATADDMCRFMLALANGGTLEGATILKPESVQQMLSRQFEADPALNGVGLVFMQYDLNGFKAWGHGGDTIAFHSDLWLVPEANFGFFMSYNSAAPKPGGGRGEVLHALFDRYFPRSANDTLSRVEGVSARADARRVAGNYQTSRRSETTFLKISALLGQTAVRPNVDGTITLDTVKSQRGEVKQWREVSPLVYQEIDGPDKLAFHADASGRITDLLPQPAVFQGERVRWFENKSLILPALSISLGLLLLTALLWPVAALVRRRYERLAVIEKRDRVLFVLTRLACWIIVIWVAVLVILASRAGTDISLLGDGLVPWLHFLHILGWLFAIGTAVILVATFRFWRLPEGSWWLRTHATLLTFAALFVVWLSWHMHLLDPSTRF